MSEKEPYKWITVMGKHIPVFRGENGEDVFGVGKEKESKEEKPNTDYMISHRPGNPLEYPDEVATVDKIMSGDYFPKDLLDHPDWYFADYGEYGDEKRLISLLKKAQKNPEMEVTIYRGAPSGDLNQGDWVTLSEAYAKDYAVGGRHVDNPSSKVHSFKAKVKDLSFDGDSIYEFGYWGKGVKGK